VVSSTCARSLVTDAHLFHDTYRSPDGSTVIAQGENRDFEVFQLYALISLSVPVNL
jgi:hypothetical protein